MAERNLSIDFIKVVAMLGVISLHTTHCFMEQGDFCFADILYETAACAIPLFFMVNGYLMLGRRDMSYKYVCHKIFNIQKFVLIISILYAILHLDFDFIPFTNLYLGAFIQKGPLWVFWYFGAIILVYAVLPLLNRLFLFHQRAFLSLMSMLLLVQFSAFVSNLVGGGK